MWAWKLIYEHELSGQSWWLVEIGKLGRCEVCGVFSWWLWLLWFFTLVSAIMGAILLSVNMGMNRCEISGKWIRQFWELVFGLLQHLLKGWSLMFYSSPSTFVFVWCRYRMFFEGLSCTCGFTYLVHWNSGTFCENMRSDPTCSMCLKPDYTWCFCKLDPFCMSNMLKFGDALSSCLYLLLICSGRQIFLVVSKIGLFFVLPHNFIIFSQEEHF